jgi:hypothetical protein
MPCKKIGLNHQLNKSIGIALSEKAGIVGVGSAVHFYSIKFFQRDPSKN